MSMWPAQRDQRAELNDALSAPRAVEHFAYFKRRGNAETAAQELSSAGFAVALGRRGFKTALQATRDESLGDDEVARFLQEAISIVERNGGEYDGWGAAVAAPPSV